MLCLYFLLKLACAEDSNISFENFERNVVDKVLERLEGSVEMSELEVYFLNGLIRKYKPKKLLEIGVSMGGSSAVILNAISDFKDAKLYSIDKEKMCYWHSSKETGYIVKKKFPELSTKWEKHTGGIAADFIEGIGKNIDFAFIDTVHITPGEMLDFLVILPFLKGNAVVVFHDIGMHHFLDNRVSYSNNQLFAYIKGKKMVPQKTNATRNNNVYWDDVHYGTFYNIGAVELDSEQHDRIFDYFFPLSFRWEYIPEEADLSKLTHLFAKYYDTKYVEMFKRSVEANKNYLKKYPSMHGMNKAGRQEKKR